MTNMTNQENVYVTKSSEATQKIAERFAQKLQGGEVIALYGDLGSGKTTFVQGLAKGLGIIQRIISPTFIIVRTYNLKTQNSRLAAKRAKLKTATQNAKLFYHIDLYRIESKKDIKRIGIEEIINDSQNIVAIEWAEKMGSLLPQNRIDTRFAYISESERRIWIAKRLKFQKQ